MYVCRYQAAVAATVASSPLTAGATPTPVTTATQPAVSTTSSSVVSPFPYSVFLESVSLHTWDFNMKHSFLLRSNDSLWFSVFIGSTTATYGKKMRIFIAFFTLLIALCNHV